MKKKIKRYSRKSIYKISFVAIILVFIVVFLGYFIIKTDYLYTGINEATRKYISFNNTDATDILNISNITKTTSKHWRSILNQSSVLFKIEGDSNKEFDIVIYPINNTVEEKYIYYYLVLNNKKITGNLSSVLTKEDGGKIIYHGTTNDSDTYRLNMWISDSYNEKGKNISYEVKIK